MLLAICLGGIGIGITAWSHWLLSGTERVEARHSLASPADAAEGFDDETASITRRTFLIRSLVAAFAGLGAALAIPALSLGPAPGRTLFETAWKAGSRVVGLDGLPVNIDSLPVDGVLTVFPEGAVGSADAQTLLIRVADGLLQLPPDRMAWAPQGCVAYSKLCTHAGCPVGLYRAAEHKLICPCHQSTFDVLDGATPTFGPAARPLPAAADPAGCGRHLRRVGRLPRAGRAELLGHDRWLTPSASPRPRRPRRPTTDRPSSSAWSAGSTAAPASPPSPAAPHARSSRTIGASCSARSRCSRS